MTPSTSPDASDPLWRRVATGTSERRRDYPRIHLRFPVRLSAGGDEHVQVCGYDLCRGGVGVRCDQATRRQIRPRSTGRHRRLGEVRAELTLEVDGEDLSLAANCRVVHATELADAEPGHGIAIGFEFLEFEGDGKERLERFVIASLRPDS